MIKYNKGSCLSKGGNELLDTFHPRFHSNGVGRLAWRSPGPQPCHDNASHLPRLRWCWRRYHAQQGGERQGSGEEVQLLWQEKIELCKIINGNICQNFNKLKRAERKVQTGHANQLLSMQPRGICRQLLYVASRELTVSFLSFWFSPSSLLSVIYFFVHQYFPSKYTQQWKPSSKSKVSS